MKYRVVMRRFPAGVKTPPSWPALLVKNWDEEAEDWLEELYLSLTMTSNAKGRLIDQYDDEDIQSVFLHRLHTRRNRVYWATLLLEAGCIVALVVAPFCGNVWMASVAAGCAFMFDHIKSKNKFWNARGTNGQIIAHDRHSRRTVRRKVS